MWSYRHLTVMLVEGRQSSLSGSREHIMLGEGRRVYTASTYFIEIFYIFSWILVPTKSLHTFLLTITPNARVISAIFREEHQKNDTELLFTI